MSDQSDISTDQVVADMKRVVDDAEALLSATVNAAGDKVAAARARMEASLDNVRGKIAETQRAVIDDATAAAQATDEYVHAHPWKTAGIAAAVGVIIGMLLARR